MNKTKWLITAVLLQGIAAGALFFFQKRNISVAAGAQETSQETGQKSSQESGRASDGRTASGSGAASGNGDIVKGVGYLDELEFDKAQECFNKAMRSDPEQAYYWLIESEICQNHFGNAEKYAEEALEKLDSEVIQQKLEMLRKSNSVLDYKARVRKFVSFDGNGGTEKFFVHDYDKDGRTCVAMFDGSGNILDLLDFTQCRPYESENLHFDYGWSGKLDFILEATDSEQRNVFDAWLDRNGAITGTFSTREYSDDGLMTTKYNWNKNTETQKYSLSSVSFTRRLNDAGESFEYHHVIGDNVGEPAGENVSKDSMTLNSSMELEEGRVYARAVYDSAGELTNRYYSRSGPVTLSDDELAARIPVPDTINMSDYIDPALLNEDSFPDSPESVLKQYNIAEQYDLKFNSLHAPEIFSESEFSACDILIENKEQVIELPEEYDRPAVQAAAAYLAGRTDGGRISVVGENADSDLHIIVRDDTDNLFTITYSIPFRTAYIQEGRTSLSDTTARNLIGAQGDWHRYALGLSRNIAGMRPDRYTYIDGAGSEVPEYQDIQIVYAGAADLVLGTISYTEDSVTEDYEVYEERYDREKDRMVVSLYDPRYPPVTVARRTYTTDDDMLSSFSGDSPETVDIAGSFPLATSGAYEYDTDAGGRIGAYRINTVQSGTTQQLSSVCEYDSSGKLVSEVIEITSGQSGSEKLYRSYTYDSESRLKEASEESESGRKSGAEPVVWTFAYNEDGTLAGITDDQGLGSYTFSYRNEDGVLTRSAYVEAPLDDTGDGCWETYLFEYDNYY